MHIQVKPAMENSSPDLRAAGDANGDAQPPKQAATEQTFLGKARKEALDFSADFFGSLRFEHSVERESAPREQKFQRVKNKQSVVSRAVAPRQVQPRDLPPQQGWSGGPPPGAASQEPEGWLEQAAVSDAGLTEQLARQKIPYFTVAQSAVACLLWLILAVRDGTEIGGLESIWPGKTDLILQWDCEDSRGEIWRWWTHQFTHIGFVHVLSNTVLLLFLGISIEGFQGSLRMFFMFNIGVFGGACCYFVADNHTRVVGMSGGCYALLGMNFGDILMNFGDKPVFHRRVRLFLLIFLTVIDIFQALLTGSNNVSHSTHFGGFVAGLLIIIVVGNNPILKRHEIAFMVIALTGGGVLVIFSLAWGMSWPPRTIFDPTPWCWTRQVIDPSTFNDNSPHCVRCHSQGCIDRWVGIGEQFIRTVSSRLCQDRMDGWSWTEE